MNRRERRHMSKKLGILQHQQKLPLNKRLELMRENILAGKQKEEEFKDQVERDIRKQIDQKESDIIYSIAEKIAKDKSIPLMDAMRLAEIEYRKGF